MNKTIVAFIEKQVVAAISEDRNNLLDVLDPKPEICRIVETEEKYLIGRCEDGCVVVILDNRCAEEELNAKLTLTGLEPHERFEVFEAEGHQVDYRLANQAGILECMYRVEANTCLFLKSC